MTIRSILSTMLLALLLSQSAYAGTPQETVAKRRAMMTGKPYTWTVPRANEPVGEITALAIWPMEPEMRFALAALQGIVNRDQPRIYIGFDKMLNWMQYHSGKVTVKGEYDHHKLFEQYKDSVKGLVVYDLETEFALNLAITYAGIEDLLPVTPKLAEDLSARYGWKVVHDLRGRWSDRLEAYTWAFENLRPRCTDHALMHFKFGYLDPMPPFSLEPSWPNQVAYGVDYSVMARMFVWFIGREAVPGEMELANRIMESVPLYTPVVGASSGKMMDEPLFVNYVASYANLHIPLYSPNVSVLSGVRIPDEQLKQKRYPVTRDLDYNKIYIAFTNSEHDNMGHVIGGGLPWKALAMETDDPYKMWWADPMRGQVPIGWPIGPLICELAPTVLARYVMTATENDYFMAALTGIGLTSLPDFGSAYPGLEDELADGYSKLSGEYMNRLGWTMVNPWSPPGTLRTFAKNIPGLEGMFEGYGRHMSLTQRKANYLMEGVPVFHNVTKGDVGSSRDDTISESYAKRASALSAQIQEVKVDERPGFMHVWTVGWDFGPTILKMVVDQLPPEYEVVRPDELASLYKRYEETHLEVTLKDIWLNASPRPVVTEESVGGGGLTVDTGPARFEIGWGRRAQPPLKRVMGVDRKWRGAGRMPFNSHDQQVSSFSAMKIKDTPAEKQYELRYTYSGGGSCTIKMTATAGRPYLLIEETVDRKNIPTWGVSVFEDFQPDTIWTDRTSEPLDYQEGGDIFRFPWGGWLLAGKKKGQDRDLIGVFCVSWDKWNNGEMAFRQRKPGLEFESYYFRSGIKKFAIAALDRDNTATAAQIDRELNGR